MNHRSTISYPIVLLQIPKVTVDITLGQLDIWNIGNFICRETAIENQCMCIKMLLGSTDETGKVDLTSKRDFLPSRTSGRARTATRSCDGVCIKQW